MEIRLGGGLVGNKTCTNCKKEKPLTQFNKKKQNRDGFDRNCRECRNMKRRAYNAKPEVADNRRKTQNEWYNNLPPDKKAKMQADMRDYGQKNKEQISAWSKQHYLDNKETYNQRSREYYLANREKCNEYGRQYYAENRDAMRAAMKLYRENNPDKVGAMHAVKKARRKAAFTDNHTTKELHAYWQSIGLDPAICVYCDGEVGDHWKRSAGDHIVPLARGGEDVLENLNPCCKPCNSSKRHSLLYEEWTPPNQRSQHKCNKSPEELGQ